MAGDERDVGARCGPETLKVISKAFDDAGAQIEPHYYETPISAEVARVRLADELMAIASEDSRDPENLKNLALQGWRCNAGTSSGREAMMGQRVRNPRYWRNYADETLAIAEQMTDPECKRLLIGVAETYAQLARRAAADEVARGVKRSAEGRG
jgi:hypothetical protein